MARYDIREDNVRASALLVSHFGCCGATMVIRRFIIVTSRSSPIDQRRDIERGPIMEHERIILKSPRNGTVHDSFRRERADTHKRLKKLVC